MRSVLIALLAAVLLAACDGDTTSTDPRFATPERTVATLLGSYGLADVSQEEVRTLMAAHERFELVDRPSFEACFVEHAEGGPEDALIEGLAGFVVGALAAGKDELRVEIAGDTAYVSPRAGVRVVLHRQDDGRFLIALRESVPEDVARRIALVAEHAEQRAQRGVAIAQ